MDGLLRRFAPLRKRFAIVAGNDGGSRQHPFFITDTKNLSVPVRLGVISQPSGVSSAALAKSSALSHSTLAVCSGGTTENSGWRSTKARTCAPFSGGSTEQVM